MAVEARERSPQFPFTREVRSTSPDFLVIALRSLPEEIHPSYFDVVVQAQDDFEPPKNGVIPHTRLNLEWMPVGYKEPGRFLPSDRNPFEIKQAAFYPNLKREALKIGFLLGGRPHEIHFHAAPHGHFESKAFAYRAFIDEELKRLLKDAFYHVHSGDLVLLPSSRIIFGHDEKMTGFVRVSSVNFLPQRKVVALNQWLANLAKI